MTAAARSTAHAKEAASLHDHRARSGVRHHAARDPLLRRRGPAHAGARRSQPRLHAARPHAAEAHAARQAARPEPAGSEATRRHVRLEGRHVAAAEGLPAGAARAPQPARAAARRHRGDAGRDQPARGALQAAARRGDTSGAAPRAGAARRIRWSLDDGPSRLRRRRTPHSSSACATRSRARRRCARSAYELGDVAPGRVVLRMQHQRSLTQQHGFLHAGMVATALDSACGYAAFTLMPADAAVLTDRIQDQPARAGARVRAFASKAVVTKAGPHDQRRRRPRAADRRRAPSALIATMTATVMTLHRPRHRSLSTDTRRPTDEPARTRLPARRRHRRAARRGARLRAGRDRAARRTDRRERPVPDGPVAQDGRARRARHHGERGIRRREHGLPRAHDRDGGDQPRVGVAWA